MRLFQCLLHQGSTFTVAWIGARGAHEGAVVEIPDLGGFWQVGAVYPGAVTRAWLVEKQRMDRQGMPDI